MKDLDKIQKGLENSLLYQMSLGSKELYHSNVWAWLIRQDPEFVNVFFPNYNEQYEFEKVEREKHNRDLIVQFDKNGKGYFYVIENKIKSLPSKEQLEKYTVEYLDGKKMLGGVFTGIRNTFEMEILEIQKNNISCNWSFISYNQIADRIQKIAEKSDKVKEKLPQILEYCDNVRTMDDIIKCALEAKENILNYNCDKRLDELLDKTGLKDVFVKLKGADFVRCARDIKLETDLKALLPKNSDFKLEFAKQSFNNGNATIDFRFSNWKEKCEDWLKIGVQLQGEEYRLLAERNKNHKEDEIYEEFKGVWFDENIDEHKKARSVFGKPTSMRHKWCKYGGADSNVNYTFVYQHYLINGKDYETLFESIKSDLKKACDIVEKYNLK